MNREFIYLKIFDKHWEELGMTEGERVTLENFILRKPESGSVIQGTGGVRKLRFSIGEGQGKRGGLRILYVDFPLYGRTFFLNVYSKKWSDNISMKDRAEYKQLVAVLLNRIRGG